MLDDGAIEKRKISPQVLLDIAASGRISTTADNRLISVFIRFHAMLAPRVVAISALW
jgi:hypothetical protein